MSLLADVRKIARKSRTSTQQVRKEDWTNRIQKRIMKIASEGGTCYRFDRVPNRQEWLVVEGRCPMGGVNLFITIAKHFHNLGFNVSYETKEGSKTKFAPPKNPHTELEISWEDTK